MEECILTSRWSNCKKCNTEIFKFLRLFISDQPSFKVPRWLSASCLMWRWKNSLGLFVLNYKSSESSRIFRNIICSFFLEFIHAEIDKLVIKIFSPKWLWQFLALNSKIILQLLEGKHEKYLRRNQRRECPSL
jgi:hypothetical protein